MQIDKRDRHTHSLIVSFSVHLHYWRPCLQVIWVIVDIYEVGKAGVPRSTLRIVDNAQHKQM